MKKKRQGNGEGAEQRVAERRRYLAALRSTRRDKTRTVGLLPMTAAPSQTEGLREWRRGGYVVTCDPAQADLNVIAAFLGGSYWAKGIPPVLVRRSVEHSLNFILLKAQAQIGFARVITDFATIGYLGDVFVLPEHRGQGLGTWLVECVMQHPELQGFRRWILATLDAHELYEQFGFTPLSRPEVFMEKFDPNVYASPRSTSTDA